MGDIQLNLLKKEVAEQREMIIELATLLKDLCLVYEGNNWKKLEVMEKAELVQYFIERYSGDKS